MASTWLSVTDFLFISLFLAMATFLKKYIPALNRLLIPTSIVAGFVGLILGPEVLNIVPLNTQMLETMVYHLMAIGFIALTLKSRSRQTDPNNGKTGMLIVSTYLIQGLAGFAISLIMAAWFLPDLFPPIGLLLPLGYGQGPGQAFSIGSQWEAIGFESGGQIGLTIATLGFLWACIGGVILLNILTRGKRQAPETGERKTSSISTVSDISEGGEIPLSSGLDKITVQLFLIGLVYLATYLTLLLLSKWLTPLGTFGQTLAQLFWGFHFLIGTVYAILMRLIYDYLIQKKWSVTHYPNDYLMQRISGTAFDFMITASISAISLTVVRSYFIPVAILSTVGGLITMFYITWISKRLFQQHQLEYTVALYGMLTGTISTGMALLKEVDPQFNSNVAETLVLGSAVGLVFGFPLMLILNIPVLGYLNNNYTFYLYTLAAFALYLLLLWGGLYRTHRRTKKAQ